VVLGVKAANRVSLGTEVWHRSSAKKAEAPHLSLLCYIYCPLMLFVTAFSRQNDLIVFLLECGLFASSGFILLEAAVWVAPFFRLVVGAIFGGNPRRTGKFGSSTKISQAGPGILTNVS
jgi:hypothetical protein